MTKSFRIFVLLGMTLSAAMPLGAYAGVSCQVENDQILTPNGNTIYLDFGAHPSSKHAELLQQTAVLAGEEGPNVSSKVKDGLILLNRMSAPLLKQQRERGQWVRNLIANDKVEWIGAEQTENELGDSTGLKQSLHVTGLRNLLKLHAEPNQVTDAIVAGACPGVAVCEWLLNKNLQKSVRLIPIESEAKIEAKKAIETKVRTIFESFEKMVQENKFSRQEYEAIQREYQNLLLATPDTRARQNARNRYRASEISKKMTELYDLAAQMKASDIERDTALVKAVFAQTGNGILSLSTARSASIVAKLEEICLGPAAAAAKKTAEPAPKKKKRSNRTNR